MAERDAAGIGTMLTSFVAAIYAVMEGVAVTVQNNFSVLILIVAICVFFAGFWLRFGGDTKRRLRGKGLTVLGVRLW